MDAVENGEMWEVEESGRIYTADSSELSSWIEEGSLQPYDKIRKGNLRWIEARKVPLLIPLFEAKNKGCRLAEAGPQEQAPSITKAELQRKITAIARLPNDFAEDGAVDLPIETRIGEQGGAESCSVHRTQSAAFVCGGCGGNFCGKCPKSFGSSVKICPDCGAFCRPLDETRALAELEARQSATVEKGFGATDFASAILYPFQYRFSFFAGALIFSLLWTAKSAAMLGGIYFVASAILCLMLANMLVFGVFAKTIDKFSSGEISGTFMPDFEDFSIWEDVLHPFVLSIGAYVVSFGAFAAVTLAGFYFVSNAVDSKMSAMRAEVEKIPGTQFYAAKDTLRQSADVLELLDKTRRQNAERVGEQQATIEGNTNSSASGPEQSGSNAAASLSVFGRSDEARESNRREIMQAILGLSPLLVIPGALALLWGLFYFPAACLVAAYTRSWAMTINPLTGLDTIRRLGGNYVKILAAGSILVISSFVTDRIIYSVSASFDLPGVGNLPGKAVSGIFSFYLIVVFSSTIGFALLKSADRLPLPK